MANKRIGNKRIRAAHQSGGLRRWFWIGLLVVAAWVGLDQRAALAQQPVAPSPLAAPSEPAQLFVVARLYFSDDRMLAELATVLDVWEVHHSAIPEERHLVAMISRAQLAALQQTGIRAEIDEAQTLQMYTQPLFAAQQSGGIPGFACYRTIDETYRDLAALAEKQPTLARWLDMGDSWDRRNLGVPLGYDLYTLVLTNQARPGPKPILFVLGAIHARELATTELATRFAETLIDNYGVEADATWLLDHTEIHILPIGNPDGRKFAEQLLYWRKNTNPSGCSSGNPFFSYYGVDLNRNSSFKWGQCAGSNCSSSEACRETYRGTGPASEPETQAIEAYLRAIFPDQRGPNDDDGVSLEASGIMISLHSFGKLVLFPWGWSTQLSPNHTELQTLAHKLGYFNQYKICQSGAAGCLYMTDGTTDDWAYGELGVAAYTIELGSAFFEQCSSFESTILPDHLAALTYAAKAAWRPYQQPAGPESLHVAATPARLVVGDPFTLTAHSDDTRYGTLSAVAEPTQNIAAARYTVDAPSWISGTTASPLWALDGLFDAATETVYGVVDTAGWPVGKRLVMVESQDATGQWGVPSGIFVELLASAYGVSATALPINQPIAPDQPLTVTLAITNTGLVSDSYEIRVQPESWLVWAAATVGPLEPLATNTIGLVLQPPGDVAVGHTTTLTVSVQSQQEPTTTAIATLSLLVGAPTDNEQEPEPDATRLFLPLISQAAETNSP